MPMAMRRTNDDNNNNNSNSNRRDLQMCSKSSCFYITVPIYQYISIFFHHPYCCHLQNYELSITSSKSQHDRHVPLLSFPMIIQQSSSNVCFETSSEVYSLSCASLPSVIVLDGLTERWRFWLSIVKERLVMRAERDCCNGLYVPWRFFILPSSSSLLNYHVCMVLLSWVVSFLLANSQTCSSEAIRIRLIRYTAS